MINVKELRTGNYVMDRGGKTLRIDWFETYKVCQAMFIGDMPAHPLTEHFEYLQPIPLTPELLEKCGFELNGFKQIEFDIPMHVDQYRKFVIDLRQGYIYLREGDDDKRHKDNIVVLWNRDLVKDYYLHSLQNLFYSITGQELQINL